MTQNTMLTLRVSKELRRKINALRRGTNPRKSQAEIVRAALEALPDPRAGGAAAPQQKTPGGRDETIPAT